MGEKIFTSQRIPRPLINPAPESGGRGEVNRGRTPSAARTSPAPFPAAAYGKAPLRQRKRRCELITTLGRNNMAAAGGRCAGREGLRYSAGVESHALERQRRPPASVKRSVNGEARLTKGRGEERRGGNKHSSPYRFLLLLHPGGHLGHGPVDGDAVVEIRHVLAAVDRQRFGGVQRPRSEGEFTHCLPALQEQPGRRRRGGRGGGEDSRRLLHLLPQCSAAGPLLLLLLTAPGHSMGAHPARKQPPAARGRFHTLDPPLARPIRSLRHGQHGGHYHSGGERSRQPARERAPAAGTRLALSLPPSFLSLPLPRLPTHSLRGAAGPRERAQPRAAQGRGGGGGPRLAGPRLALWQVAGAQVYPRPRACASASAAPTRSSLNAPKESAGQNTAARSSACLQKSVSGKGRCQPGHSSHHRACT